MRNVQKPIKTNGFLMILEVRTLKNAIEKLSKSELRTKSKAGIHFSSIWGAFWSHFGNQNRSKIEAEREKKNIEQKQ